MPAHRAHREAGGGETVSELILQKTVKNRNGWTGKNGGGGDIPDTTCCMRFQCSTGTPPQLPSVQSGAVHICKMGRSSLVGIRLRADGVQNIAWCTEALGEELSLSSFYPFLCLILSDREVGAGDMA